MPSILDRDALTRDVGAMLETGAVPTNAELQDLVESFYNFADDDARRLLADSVTQALWESYYPSLPTKTEHYGQPGVYRNSVADLLNTLLDSQFTHAGIAPFRVDTVMDLAAGSYESDYSTVLVFGYSAKSDGGAGYFDRSFADLSTEVAADPRMGLYVPFAADPTGASGGWIRRLFNPFEVHAAWWGFGEATSAAGNLLALQGAANALPYGGRILLPNGRMEFNKNSVLEIAPSPYRVEFVGGGYESCNFVPGEPGTSDFFLTVQGAAGAVCSPVFRGITVAPQVRNARDRFCGVYVKATNHARIEDCFGMWCDGTAWRFERPHNSRISVTTFESGNWSRQEPSLFIHGKTGPESANDILYEGASEKDQFGHYMTDCVNIRPGDVKWHGGPDSIRVFWGHNIGGVIDALMTLGCAGADFAYLSDDSTETSLYPIAPYAGYDANRLELTVHPMRNYVCWVDPATMTPPATENAMLRIGVDDVTSVVSVRGTFEECAANPTYPWPVTAIRLTGAGVGRVDLTDIQWDWTPSAGRIKDERTVKLAPAVAREGVAHMGELTAPLGTFVATGPLGLYGRLKYGGDQSPVMRGLALKEIDANPAWVVIGTAVPVTAHRWGSVSASGTLLATGLLPDTCNAVVSGDHATRYVIPRIAITANGIPAWNPAAYWAVDVYVGVGKVATLDLDDTTVSAALGDQKPDYKHGAYHPSGASWCMQFSQGINAGLAGQLQPLTLVLVHGAGSPAAIADVSATIYYEAQAYTV